MELTSFHHESYGTSGRSRPDPERCAVEVYQPGRGIFSHQCQRKRGYGPEGAFCRQHDPAAKKAREEKRYAEERAERERRKPRYWGSTFLDVLRQIADGHNDPRSLAKEVLERYDSAR